MRAVSYTLFGYNRERYANCFDFESYLRSMHICIRLNRILFPGWDIVVNMDEATHNSPYRPIFDWHEKHGFIRVKLFPNGEPLCRAMLRRLQTVFEYEHPQWRYSHVICRDLDSIPTLRERLMVEEWIDEDKALHCITDSVSHTIPILGGMCGFRPGYVNDIMKITQHPQDAWNNLMAMATDINYNVKGSDQDFLNRVMYPKLCTSATEHFLLGRPHDLVEGNGRHYHPPIIESSFIENNFPVGITYASLDETNRLAGHIGAAGFYESPTMRFLYWDDPFKEEYAEMESMEQFKQIFYWHHREDLR
jgi:hypothetical protein